MIRIDPTLRLTKDYVFDELGPAAFDKTSDFKLTEWLASQEDNHRIVIYQCEPELTHWTKLCIRHADVIFILTDPKDNSNIKPLERDLESLSRRTRKEMIFLHRYLKQFFLSTLKFMFSKKVTKIDEIFTVDLTLTT